MKKKPAGRVSFLKYCISLLLFVILTLAGCTFSQTNGAAPTPTEGSTPQVGTPTAPEGNDLTSCPPAGQGAVAYLPALTRAGPAQLVYFTNTGSPQGDASATLKRYDVRSSLTTTIIARPDTWIMDAQVSRDGSWLLFTANVQGRSRIQLVRIDGQYLQTLYCAPAGESVKSLTFAGSTSTQWSPDQQRLVFAAGPDAGAPTLYLLTLRTGRLDTLLEPASPNWTGYLPRTWLDNTHIYLAGMIPNSDAPPRNLYLLDLYNGTNQPESDLREVLNTTNLLCWDFDSSYDSMQLFFNQCEPKTGSPGSGRIDQLSSIGESPHLVLASQKLAITHVRVFEYGRATKLLFSVYNSGMGINFDHSQDGLWLVNTDGSGLERLTSSPNVNFNQFGQYPWSNVSRDGFYYSVAPAASPPGESILYGAFNDAGRSLTTVASRGTGVDEVYLVGWTVM